MAERLFIPQNWLVVLETWQHLDDKCYRNVTVMIYLIFVQYMKQRIQIMQHRSEYDLMTNFMKYMQHITSALLEGNASVCS